ncbi:MAG TPA: hypothetical protein VN809_03480 [Telmatospirillum sp.]|nr:hypothetical protein [Telmatospirillum sp.]
MLKRLSASVLVLCLTSFGAAQAATTACFTPGEAKAAHFRILQQEFNVAALNCQTLDPNDPTFSVRYNDFVGKFGGKLQENAAALRQHFSRAGGNFDMWMTKVANDAGQRVFTDVAYCQQAWENLDKALAMEAHEIEGFAVTAGASHAYYVQACEDAKPKAEKAKASKKSKPAAKDKTASAAQASKTE